jgi:hypothetical protein
MPKTSYNLEQKNFIIVQRLSKLPKVPIKITTYAKNLCPHPPWKQNASENKVTNSTQEP